MMINRAALKTILSHTALVLGLGTFLAILGPFGSHGFGPIKVWVYWTGLCVLGFGLGHGTGHLLEQIFPTLSQRALHLIIIPIVSLIMSGAVWILNIVMGANPTFRHLPLLLVLVVIITAFATLVAYVYDRLRHTAPSMDASMTQVAPPSQETVPNPAPLGIPALIQDKLPLHLQSDTLWSLNAEDHYLRVHTTRGEALILMRLSDALHACEYLEGHRTHRSWWVARDAIDHCERLEGRAELHLKNGVIAPVSRTYYSHLKTLGWI
ncbi:LytTR family DNA-binding domain-containing protein [Woodsholea maritima]|uniref:LytTR family DNA-binding domain-containing protein n=1 Tax=Woodsholea maritima TaxID=240237 RepID=UPI000381BEBB|nr:LytTR family DNA-binding domain-containing protein [Woodsholea maritima]